MIAKPKNQRRFILSLLLILSFAWCYQAQVSTAPREWLGMEGLQWQFNDTCLKSAHIKSMPTAAVSLAPGKGSIICRSNTFLPQANKLAFWTASNAASAKSFSIIARSRDNQLLAQREILPTPDWREQPIELSDWQSGEIFIELQRADSATNQERLSVRSRMEYFADPPAAPPSLPLLIALSFVLAACLLFFFFRYIAAASTSRFALFLFCCAVFTHFRQEVYFYWDEWHVLSRFMKLGWPGSIYTHNEHFLPLFFGYYQALVRTLGSHYLLFILISLLLHTANAVLFSKLLQRIAAQAASAKTASRLLALLFLLSALHAEALHWAFEASLLLAQTIALIGFILAWDGVSERSSRRIYAGALCCGLSPLFFGNGFATSFQLAALLGFGSLFIASQSRPSHAVTRFRKRLQWCVATLFSSALVFAGSAALYLIFREGAGHGVEQARPFENLEAVSNYLLVGTGLGTALRGMGLYPILNPSAAPQVLNYLARWLPFLETYQAQANLFFAWIGVLLLGLCILYGSWGTHRRQNLRTTAIGLTFMLSSLVLPAFGRWQLGVEQSLSLRYHYAALLGLGIVFLPVFVKLFGTLSTQTPRRPRQEAILFFVIVLHISSQFTASGVFSHFTSAGRENQEFLQQMESWNEWRLAAGKRKSWEGEPSASAGLQPRFPTNLTPGVHPDGIAEIMNWLAPSGYRKP